MPKLLSIERRLPAFQDQTFSEPHEVGHYSIDEQKQIHYDRSQMKYYSPRSPPFDLNIGYDSTINDELYNPLEAMHKFLKWIAHTDFAALNNVNFVTTPRTIQDVLRTPFNTGERNKWIICACRIDDVIYLSRIKTDEAIEREMTDKEKHTTAWGIRFEKYMTADKPNGRPNPSSVIPQTEYFTVIENKIGEHTLLLAAEIDCIDASKSTRLRRGDPSCYVELKTAWTGRERRDFRSTYSFKKHKSLQWWCQSALVGIEENICGLRDAEGIVRSIKSFKTKDLPSMCQGEWSLDVCFNFCNDFLECLNQRMKNNPRIVYKFEYLGGSEVVYSVLENPEEQYQLIPDWYWRDIHRRGSR